MPTAAIGDASVEKGERLLTYSQRGPRREALGGRPTPVTLPRSASNSYGPRSVRSIATVAPGLQRGFFNTLKCFRKPNFRWGLSETRLESLRLRAQ